MIGLEESERRMNHMKYLDIIALVLLIIGGINWLLIGLLNMILLLLSQAEVQLS